MTLTVDRLFDNGIIKKAEPGGIAYEIYLWHGVCICIWMIISRKLSIIDLNSYQMMFVFTGIVVVLSTVMYHLVEKKITAFLKRKIS